ncbi:hypothetical protein ACFQRB_18205 [Halobaculum litoreum]|uniref:Uncharacterized protein n=1 Tax=Halobaculum litoreum TaxID=3031998 RepID=A0ABD5XWI8_9EURY
MCERARRHPARRGDDARERGGHHASEYSRPVETLVVSFDPEAPLQGPDGQVLELVL